MAVYLIAAKKWKQVSPSSVPIADPAITSLKKCIPKIILETAMLAAAKSRHNRNSG